MVAAAPARGAGASARATDSLEGRGHPATADRKRRNKQEATATGCFAEAGRKASLVERRRQVLHRERSRLEQGERFDYL